MNNNEANNGSKSEVIKRYIPVIGIIVLTLFLMIFFRFHKRGINRIIEEGKNNLVSFYSENLKPLFVTTEISNEDIFNFALYNSIPIDKKQNKVLTISNEGTENQVYEIKPLPLNHSTDNYNRFIDYLELNEVDKQKADSILNSYKNDIYLSVLTNDKNTVAVSPKLIDLQKAILADLIGFAQNVNELKAKDLFAYQFQNVNHKKLSEYALSAKETQPKEYFFITPDTAFSTLCQVEPESPKNKLKQIDWNKEISLDELKDLKFQFEINNEVSKKGKSNSKSAGSIVQILKPDSNFYKVIVPIPAISQMTFTNDSVKIKLEKAAEKIRNLSIHLNDRNSKRTTVSSNKNESGKNSVQFYFQDPTEIVSQTLKILSNKEFKNWDEFGVKIDSIARNYAGQYADSLIKKNNLYREKRSEKQRSTKKSPN